MEKSWNFLTEISLGGVAFPGHPIPHNFLNRQPQEKVAERRLKKKKLVREPRQKTGIEHNEMNRH